jgi:hypothetical protein
MKDGEDLALIDRMKEIVNIHLYQPGSPDMFSGA